MDNIRVDASTAPTLVRLLGGKHLLIIGGSDGATFGVIGTLPELETWLDQARDVTRQARRTPAAGLWETHPTVRV